MVRGRYERVQESEVKWNDMVSREERERGEMCMLRVANGMT